MLLSLLFRKQKKKKKRDSFAYFNQVLQQLSAVSCQIWTRCIFKTFLYRLFTFFKWIFSLCAVVLYNIYSFFLYFTEFTWLFYFTNTRVDINQYIGKLNLTISRWLFSNKVPLQSGITLCFPIYIGNLFSETFKFIIPFCLKLNRNNVL